MPGLARGSFRTLWLRTCLWQVSKYTWVFDIFSCWCLLGAFRADFVGCVNLGGRAAFFSFSRFGCARFARFPSGLHVRERPRVKLAGVPRQFTWVFDDSRGFQLFFRRFGCHRFGCHRLDMRGSGLGSAAASVALLLPGLASLAPLGAESG